METETAIQRYRRLVRGGDIHDDDAQRAAVEKLQLVQSRLSAEARRTAFQRIFHRERRIVGDRGLYLYGGVGRGKSMLMDLFNDTAPIEARRRVHFHAFMLEIHAAIREIRAAEAGQPVLVAADRVAAAVRLLCFDEFQVGNIADAMILGQLFQRLFDAGVTVVITSNQAPDELYADGLNRSLFVPFIELLKDRLDLHELAGPKDYRIGGGIGEGYFTPLGPAATASMDAAWRAVAGSGPCGPRILRAQGRTLRIPRATERAGRADFESLCGAPRGAADFLALADAFEAFFLDDIPVLPPARRDVALRFTILVDALYEAGRSLYCSAAGEPEALCPAGDAAATFRRTASRLHELRRAAIVPPTGV